LEGDLELDPVAGVEADLAKMLPVQVELDVSEAVDVENGGADPVAADLGLGQVEADEGRRVEPGAERPRIGPVREMGGRRREDVAAVKGGRDGFEAVFGARQLERGGDAAQPVGGGDEQAVVGPDVETPV